MNRYELVPLAIDKEGKENEDPINEMIWGLEDVGADTSFGMTSIHHIYINEEDRSKGIGSRIIQNYCNDSKDSLIAVVAGVMETELFTVEETLSKLDNFYTKNDFICINDYVGCWDVTILYVYNNKYGRYVISKLKEYNDPCNQ